MRYLGIDYGDARIGIAISDEEGSFAFPREVISSEWQVASKKIKELIAEENIKTIIVGLPQNFKGDDTQQTKKVREFAERLKKELGVEVVFENEVLTSRQIEKTGASTKAMIDASSAALILQQHLNRTRIE